MLTNYSSIFRVRAFRLFWLGFSFSEMGDAMTRVALTWFVYERTKSPEALGLLMLCYIGPVVIGGLIAGTLLDRFDRRTVMFLDNLLRGAVMTAIPILYALQALELWHIYLAAAIYGLLFMISIAGGPSLVPALVSVEQLATANALESVSFTLGDVVGPVIAGVLIPIISAPNVVLIDALSYFLYALALFSIKPAKQVRVQAKDESLHMSDAVQLLFRERALLATTIMYMLCYFAFGGIFSVVLPIYSTHYLGGGAELYGILLGAMAAGQLVGAFMAGGRKFPLTLGMMICLTVFLDGVAILPLALTANVGVAIVSLFLFGTMDSPTTVWAQTLRMQVIPERLRGRTFALIRTCILGFGPVGAVFAGLALPFLGVPVMLGVAAVLVALPGALGLRVRELRQADGRVQEAG